MPDNKVQASRIQAGKNIVINVVAKIVVMLLPFATRTVIIYSLGVEYLGIDSLFASILNVLSLSELGFSSAIVFSMYKPIAEGNDKKVCALLTYYKKVYRIVGCIILGIGLILLPNIHMFIAKGTEYPLDINLYIIYSIFLFNTCISYFLFAYRSSLLAATMRTDVDALFNLGRSILQYGLQLLVVTLFKQYYLYILVVPIVTVVNNLMRNIWIVKRYPQYCIETILPKEDRRDIFFKVRALIGNKLGGMIFSTADNIVISAFLGLEILGKFSNYNLIFTTIYAIESVAYTSIQPIIGNVLVTRSQNLCYALFKKLFVLNACITAICTACFVVLYQPFMLIWVKKENMLPNSIPILFAIYYMVKSTRRLLFVYKEAAGMWCEDFWKPYVSVTVNLIVNIILVKLIGLPGIIISSVAAILFVEIPWETKVFFKKFFRWSIKSYIGYFTLAILLSIMFSLICSILGKWICQIVSYPLYQIVILLAMCIIVGLIMSIPILLNSPWRDEIQNFIKKHNNFKTR